MFPRFGFSLGLDVPQLCSQDWSLDLDVPSIWMFPRFECSQDSVLHSVAVGGSVVGVVGPL